MIAIRGGKGFGDALYVQSIARHLYNRGQNVEVCSPYPDVFLPLAGRVTVSPFRRERIDRIAHYVQRKRIAGTDQFRDCCISAGLREEVELRLDWQIIRNRNLVAGLRRPLIAVQMPRLPMNRADGYGLELLPRGEVLQQSIDLLRRHAAVVQIGQGESRHPLVRLDYDLANKTSVADVIDIVATSDAVLGYCSFLVPLAESLNKPGLFIWSRRGLQSRNEFIRLITPEKIFHRSTSRCVVDDCDQESLRNAVDALCEQIGYPVQV